MSEINYQALREIAKKATQGEWVAFISPGKYGTYAVHTPGDNHHGDIVDWPGFDEQKNAENNARYIAAFNPEVVQALLDERERNQQYIKRRDQENEDIALTVGKLRVELEAAEKRIAELEAEPVSNSDELPLDYLQGHKDGLEWAAQLAEANHPQTGDWLYDDPIDLARAIRKGPDMPTVQAGNYPVTPDGWISCSERMPAQDDWILIYSKHGEYMAGQVQGEYVELSDGTLSWLGNALFWMPLPEPPQEAK
ncbi:TPA: ead/Ea22-like family protein [Escherichia coli]|nr:ead/Ea22-like family protein [Escherichia coli]HEC3494980.1 ead/Ea22-like family protein [Escherichia coli]